MKNLAVVIICMLLPFMKSEAQLSKNKFEKEISIMAKANYLLYLPEHYKSAKDKKWPLMIFLHGSGERGDNLDQVKKHGPPKLVENGRQFDFILVSPQCPAGKRWDVNILNELLHFIIDNYAVDTNRIYLTGLSMGGYGTWDWAINNPKIFAAIAPICGGGDPQRACKIKNMPVWVFHGAKDNVVQPWRSEIMVDALKKCNANVKYTVYPDAGHDAWTQTYNNQELFEWFLQQKKK